MDQEQQSRQRTTRRQFLWAGATVGLLTIAILIGYRYGITLWDWIKLLVVPAVIAGGGLWFNAQQREREQQIADARAQDEALQSYLDGMSLLLTDKERPLHRARPGDSLSEVARARTLTVLPRLDGARKGSVVRFLYEVGLIRNKHVILDLAGADLRGICLSASGQSKPDYDISFRDERNMPPGVRWAPILTASLRNLAVSAASSRLSGANLSLANLSGARLPQTYLDETNLRDANLRSAQVSYADLRGADLRRAYLREATLERSDLEGAALSEANLSYANLSNVQGVTNEELEYQTASVEGATMPNGQKYEDWIKSRGEEDSATPEQRGPWWGGPYHRGFWRRFFGA